MSEKVSVYHYTKKTNVDKILSKGLIPGTMFNTLGSRLREGANYFWLSPDHDKMGCKNNDDYACLRIIVDEKHCIIGNMDIISAAFFNFIMEKRGESHYEYKELVKLFDMTAVKYNSYEEGLFRAPEIIVQKEIPPGNIKVVNPSEIVGIYPNNHSIYNERIKNKLMELTGKNFSPINELIGNLEKSGKIMKIAEHDDSNSVQLLHSYLIKATNEVITFEVTA